MPDSDLVFQVKVLTLFMLFPLGSDSFGLYLTQWIYQLVLESQLTHKTVD